MMETSSGKSFSVLKMALLLFTASILAGMFIYGIVTTFSVFGAQNVLRINTVLPSHGAIAITAGTGTVIVNKEAESEVQILATGVQQVSGVAPGISVTGPQDNRVIENTGVNSVIAGTGIAVAGIVQSPVVINTGLLNASAGLAMDIDFANPQAPVLINNGVRNLTSPVTAGLEIDYALPRQPAIGHTLSRQMNLPAADAQGPVVSYQIVPFTTAANSWARPPYGLVPGEGGQGDSGIQWAVPANGFYMVSATCYADINLQALNNRVGLSLALVLGSNGSDPFTGQIIPGGILRLDLSRTDTTVFTAAPTLAPTAAPTTNSPTTRSPTVAPTTNSPTTKSPTVAPTTKSPTVAPTTRSPTAAITTDAPTNAPTDAPTEAPTEAPSQAPTSAPSTGAPTTAGPTTAPPTVVLPMLDNQPISVTGSFQACSGCPATVGDVLFLHLMLDSAGPSPDVLSMESNCIFQISRIV